MPPTDVSSEATSEGGSIHFRAESDNGENKTDNIEGSEQGNAEANGKDREGNKSGDNDGDNGGNENDNEGGNENGEEDDEEGGGEEEFEVEKILGHEFAKDGSLHFIVKWKGYEDPADETVEPEDNMKQAPDALDEYFKSIGGRPAPPEKPRSGRKRKSAPSTSATPTKVTKKYRSKASSAGRRSEGSNETGNGIAQWTPKGSDWEKQVQIIDTIQRDSSNGLLYAYLAWNNGKKSKVKLQECYEKCPQKMLRFYEQHLVFKEN